MYRRSRRAWPVAVVLATLLIPSVAGTAGVHSTLERKKARLDRVEQHIEVGEAEARVLRRRIDALSKQITKSQMIVNALDADIADVERQVRDAQTRIDRTQARIDKVAAMARAQAVELYKTGAVETLDALLHSESLVQLNDRIELLGVAQEESTGALVQYTRLQHRIEAQHRVLYNAKQQLEERRRVRAAELKRISRFKSQTHRDLTKLEGELHSHKEKEGRLEGAIARITGTIQQLQAKRQAESLGTSTQGFIWPLNGRITSGYGYRWGRMHAGIDIDGYTGQMIVASKDGVVIMASSYSGYGNTVIIDHGGGIATLYAHLSSFDVRNGQRVRQGQVVGRVGCTGSCTGDHLHFEVRVNGSPRNPLDYLP